MAHSRKRLRTSTGKPSARPARALRRAAAQRSHAKQASGFRWSNAEIERGLLTGEDAGVLEDYFGSRDYAELRELAQRATATRARGGPKVLILPGITGSRLGQGKLVDNMIWFDPIELAAGGITKLALNSGVSIVSMGVILLFYLKLKLRLQLAGIDADYHAYDWRQSLDTLGAGLANRIRTDPALDGVSLVCHSMGGLVARAAITALGTAHGSRIARVIMLGTPNFGSFSAVQNMRGVGDTLKKLAFLDLRHDAEEIVTRVLAPMPGFCQLLPSPERFTAIDLFDPSQWPATGPQPVPAVLRKVPKVLKKLAPADDRFYLIAGVNRETITGVRKEGDEFVYEFSLAGDGTVPLAFAEIPGTKATYYIEETHGSLPNNRLVARAVSDILGTGSTSLLPQHLAGARGDVTRAVSESVLGAQTPYPGRRSRNLSRRELREVLSEFVSANSRDAEAAAPPPAGPVSGTGSEFEYHFDSLVIGRRRSHRLDIRVALGDIGEVDATTLIMGIYREVAPSGAAGALNARLNGAITELTQRRMFNGNVGEVFLLPTAQRNIRAQMVAFVGLGTFDTFTNEVLGIAAENAIRTLILGGIQDVATVLVGGASGSTVRSSLESLLVGFVKGLKDADATQKFRSVTLCEAQPERFEEIKRELFRLSSTELFEDLEITFDEVRLPPALPAAPAERLTPAAPDPIYLLVRQEQQTPNELTFRTSVLGAGGKATVVSGVRRLNKKALDDRLAELESNLFSFQRAPEFGRVLASMVISEEALAVVTALKDRHVVVVHDAESSRIPWETVATQAPRGNWLFAKEAGISRRYVADHLSVARWLEERRQDAVLNLLLVVNPTQDLPGAEKEGNRVLEILGAEPAARVDVLRGAEATRAALEKAFRSGKYDAIHYAGHAFFDPADPGNSGILCAGKSVLSGRDLVGLGNLPALVFFNACEAGRVRRAPARGTPAAPTIRQRIDTNVGLAEAFLRGGVANYVGTYWPVGDDPAKLFAERFYKGLMNGQSIGVALVASRKAVWETGSVDWADYIHYGSYDFVMKIR